MTTELSTNTVSTPSAYPNQQELKEVLSFAESISKSAMIPDSYRGKPSDIMISVLYGKSLGLDWMTALQNIASIRGKPVMWGDAPLALCRKHADFDGITETMDGEGDKMTAACVIKRKGDSPTTASFSVGDAKRAGLWGKAGPWKQYPERMLKLRARGFCLRDAFGDALMGLGMGEEQQDIADAKGTQTTTAEPVSMAEEASAEKITDAEVVLIPESATDKDFKKACADAQAIGHDKQMMMDVCSAVTNLEITKSTQIPEDMRQDCIDALNQLSPVTPAEEAEG